MGSTTKFFCSDKPYQVRGKALTCDLHSLLYQIECNRITEKANEIIHVAPAMGKGHSNLPESKFHVLTKFKPKSTNLHQLHHEFSTDLGLCQSNVTYLVKCNGPLYHLARDLFKMGLPEVNGLDDITTKENLQRMRRLVERQKTDKATNKRVPSSRSSDRNRRGRGNIHLKILYTLYHSYYCKWFCYMKL